MRLGMRKRRRCGLFAAVSVLAAALIVCHFFLKRAEPSFIAQSSNYSNTAFTRLVGECVAELASTEEFSEFFALISDSNERMTAIEADTARINLIKSKLLMNIQNALSREYPAYVNIPLGSLSGYYLLSGTGPRIPVRVMPVSVVSGSFDEEFVSAGINQVKHKIYLDVSVDMRYSGYLLNETEKIETSVPIAETVIIGDVPQYYGSGYAFSTE